MAFDKVQLAQKIAAAAKIGHKDTAPPVGAAATRAVETVAAVERRPVGLSIGS